MTILDLLRKTAARHATKTALTFGDRALAFADLDGGSNAAARVLRSHGLVRGDRITLIADRSLEFVLAYLGALKAGAVCVLTNPAYRQRELAWILSDAQPRLVLTDERRNGDVPTLLLSDLYRDMQKTSLQPIDTLVEDDDLALLLYTSGTTGRPKGAMLTHGNLDANIRALIQAFRWTEDDHLMHVLPLFHVHGLCVGLHGVLATGCSATLMERADRFDAREVLERLSHEEATLFMGVPTHYARFIEHTPPTLERMRLFVAGSAPLPTHVATRFEQLTGHQILERYGMTETLITVAQPYDGPRRPGTVGVPVAGIETRIENGELQVKGASVGPGYWQNAAATKAAFDGAWFKTGDLVEQDDDGLLRIVGRARELIISGGMNVYPREVEEVLLEHDEVAEVAVFGIPDDDFGEAVTAAVVLRENAHATPDDLITFAKDRLASFKKPRSVFVLTELPKNAMGKVVKAELVRAAGRGCRPTPPGPRGGP